MVIYVLTLYKKYKSTLGNFLQNNGMEHVVGNGMKSPVLLGEETKMINIGIDFVHIQEFIWCQTIVVSLHVESVARVWQSSFCIWLVRKGRPYDGLKNFIPTYEFVYAIWNDNLARRRSIDEIFKPIVLLYTLIIDDVRINIR